VLAVIRGSATNQDGASNGLTAPNGPSQERVIRQALANAGLSPADVDAVEGHGTGTTLGDPIEAQALLATYGRERAGRAAAARVDQVEHRPHAGGGRGGGRHQDRRGAAPRGAAATLHVDEPSPHVDWSTGDISCSPSASRGGAGERTRRAAVSSFGISGTNAHVIVEEAPAAPGPERAEPPVVPLLVSARTEGALRAQAERLAAHLEERPELPVADAAFTLATGRAALERRAAVVAVGREELLAGLGASRAASPRRRCTRAARAAAGSWRSCCRARARSARGWGRGLYEAFPVFAAAFDAVCAEFGGQLERPLKEVVFDADCALLDETRFTQAALFALEVALYRLVASFGVRPDVLIGHSVGELAAAHIAGVWSLADACRWWRRAGG
jgi:acyl transferase domain-containing protein